MRKYKAKLASKQQNPNEVTTTNETNEEKMEQMLSESTPGLAEGDADPAQPDQDGSKIAPEGKDGDKTSASIENN